MYAKLKGTVQDIFLDFIIVDVAGIGFKVEIIENNFLVDSDVDLYVYTHVRENEIRLFGMKDRNQYLLFTDLIDISGVGPKMALTILSQLSFDEILSAVSAKDVKSLKVKGVGTKTAQRIVIDLTSKLDKYSWTTGVKSHSYSDEFVAQTKDTLQNLGFGSHEIVNILKDYASEQKPEELETIVKFALKYIKNK